MKKRVLHSEKLSIRHLKDIVDLTDQVKAIAKNILKAYSNLNGNNTKQKISSTLKVIHGKSSMSKVWSS